MTATVAALSEKQQAVRATGLGASEVPTALGLNPHQSAAELAALKRGELPPFEGNRFTHWGQRLERVIAEEWLDQHRSAGEDVSIFTPGTLRHGSSTVLLASPDRVIVPAGRRARDQWLGLLEIKAVSAYRADEFDDDLPEAYLVQVQVQLEVAGLERAWLVLLIGGNDYREIPITRDREMGGMLVEFAAKWWADHVVQGLPVPLDGSEASASFLKRRFPQNLLPALPATPEAAELVTALRRAKAAKKAAETEEAAAAAALKASIGEALGFDGLCTWKNNKPSTEVDWEQVAISLAKRLPSPIDEVWSSAVKTFTTTTPGARVLRLAKE